MKKAIIVVQGAQWGSEGKGMVAAALCKERNVDFAVRTGAVNAGHTVMVRGNAVKMQQLPTGFINPATHLVIGPGALIHPDILLRELRLLTEVHGFDPNRLHVDFRCGLHTEAHTKLSAASDRHHLIGATGKGCSEALMDRIRLRGKGNARFIDTPAAHNIPDYCFTDTTRLLNAAYDRGQQILLEGTQGSGLDLYLGPWPYTTHKPCQAATWVQESGLSPSLEYEVILVARTYPIRVAGNSGPMPDEISWVRLARRMNSKAAEVGMGPAVEEWALQDFEKACAEAWKQKWPDAPSFHIESFTLEQRLQWRDMASELHKNALEMLSGPCVAELSRLFELTTVTKKLRRVSEFNLGVLEDAICWNRPSSIVLTFLNYWFPETRGTRSKLEWARAEEINDRIKYLSSLPMLHGTPITHVTTGPETECMVAL
jgi:adenylosuccinate synthase